ncbi:MAG: flagellar motor protein MotB [Holophagaceae bacterium]|uniref:Flagellar motor protein MotB n=1 Tax=Candidatus Geothrix skivensis TaxID=2954439 RepID=A0A9D7SFW4_9BACT|nr:flagellar motor protein MotB [Candidatus Geothrix skivensis]
MGNFAPMRFARRKADLESLWLVTFADLMVQLMAFFALLYSFSVADQTKLQQALNSIQKALGVQTQASAGDGILPGSRGMDPAKAEDLEKQLSAAQADDGRDVGTRLRFVTFRAALIFDEGSAALTPAATCCSPDCPNWPCATRASPSSAKATRPPVSAAAGGMPSTSASSGLFPPSATWGPSVCLPPSWPRRPTGTPSPRAMAAARRVGPSSAASPSGSSGWRSAESCLYSVTSRRALASPLAASNWGTPFFQIFPAIPPVGVSS